MQSLLLLSAIIQNCVERPTLLFPCNLFSIAWANPYEDEDNLIFDSTRFNTCIKYGRLF